MVHEAGKKIDHVHFPVSGLASLQFVMRNGRAVDTAMVGREGALGLMVGFAGRTSNDRCITRTPLTSLTISSSDLRRLANEHRDLESICITHLTSVLSQTQKNAAHYALLPIELRLANCLLDSSDTLLSEKLPLTQEVIAEMLAVGRTLVTEAATKLQTAGIIKYSRGTIQILDRSRLSKWAHATKG